MEEYKTVKVWLAEVVYQHMLEETSRWPTKETGGVLIGYWGSPDEAVVCNMIGPGPNAIHTPTSFIPDQMYQEMEIQRLYYNSDRTETYLGDWHTHPQADSYLSGKDKATLKRIALYKPARLNRPLMMVIGTNPIVSNIWYYENSGFWRRGHPEQCRLLFFNES